MLGNLNESEIDNLLVSQAVGRMGFTDGKRPYIIPVTYVFDGKKIIGQTKEGMKLNAMRKNPNVCFEIDVMTGMDNWKSVIVSGKFKELTGDDATKARKYLFSRVLTLMTKSAVHKNEYDVPGTIDDSNRVKPVMYEIDIKEKTGRFEKQ